MIRFAENLNKMITAGLGGATEAPRTEVAVGHRISYLEASGPVASFETNIAVPIKKLLVDMLPVQSGSGDPSPDNIRPITGRDSVTVTRTGKNLVDEAAIFGTIQGWTSSNGVYTGEAMYIHHAYANGIPGLKFKPSTQYTVSVRYSGSTSAIGIVIEFSYTDGTSDTQYCNSATPDDFQLVSSADKRIEKLKLSYGRNIVVSVSNFQIVEGSTATDYEPYDGQSATIQLGQTVYGGTLDVGTGVMKVDWANIASYDGETLPGEWISDRDAYSPGATPTTGAQVCYKLAEPLTIQLSPQTITILLGYNNVWSDAGNISLEYPYYEETEGY